MSQHATDGVSLTDTNEGSHLNGPVGWSSFPAGLDFISIDGYAVGAAEVDAQQAIYDKSILPKLMPHQRAVAVPGLFGCVQRNGQRRCNSSTFARTCNCAIDGRNMSHASQGAELVAKLDAYEAWAAREPRLGGLMPYKYETDSGPRVGAFELGSCAFPALQPALARHGWLPYGSMLKCRHGRCRD